MKIYVNQDKIMKELWQVLSYKNVVVLRMRLEGASNRDIMNALGLTTEEAITQHFNRIKKVLGLTTNSAYIAHLQLGMVCYERGYVTIEEDT